MFFKSKAKKRKEEIDELKELKGIKLQSVLIAILFILLGLVLAINPLGVTRTICYTIGSIILCAGVVFIIIYLVSDYKDNINKNKLVIGIALTIIGILFFILYRLIVSVIPTVIGVLIFINGLTKLQTALDARRINKDKSLWMIIMAIVVILAGAFAIINPFGVSGLVLRVLGVILMISGITDLVSFVILNKRIKDHIKDMEALEQ